jgi:REP-associated tyrosine transposase
LAGLVLLANGVSAPRLVLPGSTVLVTRRTARRHHLFAPDAAMRALYTYVLSVCAAKFGILVHEIELMSTHEHLLLTDPRGVLPDFLRELHRLVALGTKVLRKWEGPVWESEKTSVVRLLTPQAIVEKIAYCMANPVAAGLVNRACDWPGLSTLPEQLGRGVLTADRPTFFFDAHNAQWPETAQLALTLPPSLEGQMSLEEFQGQVAAELERQQKEARQEVAKSGRGFLGVDRCQSTSPYRRARSFEPLRDRNPTFAVGRGNRQAFFAAVEELRAFRAAYREALRLWRQGVRDVAFPPGTWAMKQLHAVVVQQRAA